mmetsp:Transcript_90/g.145  ORF Transcript_90/g.145 Transcript_90/m.145 type:complete len:201 (-) Transcript_90:630-1232(-)
MICYSLQDHNQRQAHALRRAAAPADAIIGSSTLVLETLLLSLLLMDVSPDRSRSAEALSARATDAELPLAQGQLPIGACEQIVVGSTLHTTEWTGHNAIIFPWQHECYFGLGPPQAVPAEQLLELFQRVLSHCQVSHGGFPLLPSRDGSAKARLELGERPAFMCAAYPEQGPEISQGVLQGSTSETKFSWTAQLTKRSVQ